MGPTTSPVDRDFFVSFTGADRPWAEWLLLELDAVNYTSVSQLRDFVGGGNFALDMDRSARRARRTLGVLSSRALQSPYVRQEWAHRLASDPTGEQRALVLVRVEPCQPEGLLGPVVYIDLVGLDEAAARARLREELAAVMHGHRQLPAGRAFPGAGASATITDSGRARFPTALPPVWNVPFHRNPAFTDRDQELALLAATLQAEGTAAVTQVLQGGGGVGKTSLAVEYAYRQRNQFDAVWWVRAEEPATLMGDYASLGVACGVAERSDANQQLAAIAVRRWLEDHDRWLLVLDNAEAPDTPVGLEAPINQLVELLPRVVHGQILVTTRNTSWEAHAAVAELEVFPPEEAVAFLLTRSGSSDERTATEIAELLGWLPLALEQAGAYVRETRLPLAAYLERLRQFPAITLTKGHPRDRNPADTVATTWQVSLERVQSTPGAATLLEVCAFLGPEGIPRELFAQRLDPPVDDLAVLAIDPFALDEAVAAIRRFGLVKVSEQTLMMHRLLQQVIRERLDHDQQATRAAVALRLVRGAFPTRTTDPHNWPTYTRLLSHALAVTGHAEALALEGEEIDWLLTEAGLYLRQRADHQQARALLERALAIREVRLGPDHPDTARTLNHLANVLLNLSDYDQALALNKRALAIRETRLGLDHPDTAESLNNLATLLRYRGDLDRARALHERAVAIYETRLGEDHPLTAWSLIDLALVLRDQGHLEDACALYEQALGIFERRLGPDHPDTAHCVSRLATALTEQGDLERAIAVHQRALAIREARLAPDHPDIAHSLTNFGRTLTVYGDLDRARPLLERALHIRETRLGEDHHFTAHTLNDLARVLAAQGDLDGARGLHERALVIYDRLVSADHFDAAQCLYDLANVLTAQGDLERARTLHERALTIRDARLGPDHPDTQRSRKAVTTIIMEQDERRQR